MATITVVTRKSKRADGKLPIYLRIHHKDTTRYVSLGVHVAATYWNGNKNRVRRTHTQSRQINRYLSEATHDAEEAVSALIERRERLTAARIKELVQARLAPEEEGGCFFAFCQAQVQRYRERGQAGSARAYGSTVNKLRDYLTYTGQRRPLPFEAVGVGFFEQYRTWELTERGNKKNTVAKALGHMRTFCNAAIREGLMAPGDYPFRHITISRETTPRRQWLRKEEIQALEQLEPTLGTVAADTLRIFLFQYYAWGMRISDALFLQWHSVRLREGRLQYQMMKTDKHLDLPLVPEAREIIEYYADRRERQRVFPLLDGYDLTTSERAVRSKEARTAKINYHLADFREQLVKAKQLPERRKLSTHSARHSAACQMYLAWRDIWKIKRFLGHSDIKVTQKYLKSMEGLPLGHEGDWQHVL